MKPAAIIAIGLIGVSGVFLFELYVPAILFVLACSTVLMVLGGTLLPVNSRTCNLSFHPSPEEEKNIDISRWHIFEGIKIDPQEIHTFKVRLQMIRIWQLGTLGVIALLEIGLVLAFYQNPFQLIRDMDADYFFMFFLCFASLIQISIAWTWVLERKLLASSALAIGDFDAATGRYTFRDPAGEPYGGTKRPVAHSQNNTCMVFYLSGQPQINVPSFRFRFHRLLIG